MFKTKTKKHNTSRRGMTLVEIILAMAILSVVVILMTPVMLNAFQMITLSGDRHNIAKGIAGNVEDHLAGEAITETLNDVSIALPGGLSVNGKAYELNQGSDAKYVDLWGYIINSMAIVDPTGTGSTSSTTTSATGETSSSESTAETTSPTAPQIELKDVMVDVSDWRNDTTVYKYGTIDNTTTQMEYQVTYLDGTPYINWTTCSSSSTSVYFSTNTSGYLIVVRQKDNIANNKHMRVRARPLVAFHDAGSNKTTFYVYDYLIGSWRQIVSSDDIEVILTPSDTWHKVDEKTKINKLDTSYVYARYAASASYDEGGTTIDDPASFPNKITSFQ